MTIKMIRITPLLRGLRYLALAGGLTCAAHTLAADVYVIAHPSAKLAPDAIRDVYIGEKQFAGDVKLIPIDNASAQGDFLAKVLRLDPSRYANLWVKKSFRDALNPPAVRNSDKEIIDYVAKTPGAVAYTSSPPPANVVVLQKF